ncbi:serine hydroxymethyltransferase, partial [candidate division KSB1 bacterium]|nr:serine hydroxymethyltransferase [candidate division KSB1 bacterium]
VEELAVRERPALIITGASAYSREIDYAAFRTIADKIGAKLLADIAHPAGLIAAGLIQSPIPHCHVVTTTTHKTLRGPRGGMILIGRDAENDLGITTAKGQVKKWSEIIDSNVFPGFQGGPLMHVIAAKAVSFTEALQPDFITYQKRVIKNAQTLADCLSEKGYKIVSGGTDTHVFLVDLSSRGLTGKAAEKALDESGITVNKNMVPFDTQSPFQTSGIRLGTPALTTRGMNEDDMRCIASLIDRVLTHITDVSQFEKVRGEVAALARTYPLYAEFIV